MSTLLDTKDEITMSLVHYFVTEENYTPINVQGVKNEIWLENLEGPCKIIRINSKYIHNNEQLDDDLNRMHFIMDQIKKKTLSFKMSALNICLDLSSSVEITDEDKSINTININSIRDIKKNSFLTKLFPNIKTNKFKRTNNLENVINVTDDINKKTEEENKKYENIFKPKKLIVTNILIVICIALFIISLLLTSDFTTSLIIMGANNRILVLNGDYYRLITCSFLHANIIHLLVNMYSLWIISSQVETYLGKWRVLVIYLLSALMGSLFSIVFLPNSLSVGASGAIFGLMGSLLYFGYHYRLYLSGALTSQILPVIVINLLLGFTFSGIDNWAHIGGLIGGYLSTMIVGVKYKTKKSETINGIIVYLLLVAFLIYVLYRAGV